MINAPAVYRLCAAFMVCVFSGPVVAYCSEYIVKKTPGPDEFTTICSNTLSQPAYHISQHFVVDGASTSFRFSPRTSNILCHEYEIGDYLYSSCKSHGIRSSYGSFETRQSVDVSVRPLGRDSDGLRELLDENEYVFSSADSLEIADIDRCLVVLKDKSELVIAFDEAEPLPLAICLEKFERYVTKNKLFR